jgi:hypothetical protein
LTATPFSIKKRACIILPLPTPHLSSDWHTSTDLVTATTPATSERDARATARPVGTAGIWCGSDSVGNAGTGSNRVTCTHAHTFTGANTVTRAIGTTKSYFFRCSIITDLIHKKGLHGRLVKTVAIHDDFYLRLG